ncbi:MAG: methyl-accepting chemotaxis protein [Leptolyngbyaceae cyanobacterium]
MVNQKKLWKLRYWIMAGYAVPVVALLFAAGTTVSLLSRAKYIARELGTVERFHNQIMLAEVDIQIMSRTSRGYLLAQDAGSRQAYEVAFDRYTNTIAALKGEESAVDHFHAAHHVEVPELAEFRARLPELEQPVERLQALNRTLIQLVNEGEADKAIQLWRENAGNAQARAVSVVTEEMILDLQDVLQTYDNKQTQTLTSLQQGIMGLTLSSLLLSLGIGVWAIYKTASQMNNSASNIASSTAEIAASIEQQEKIASQQAASINQTTTTIDELGASSRQSAEQAEAAAAGAQQALNLAEGGTTAVEQTLEGMELLRQKVGAIAEQILRLSEQTSQIGSISGLVSDLANQTNMLALNAAVEAVRAGEHGKGFTVVSGEIRKLADQSKKSAEKINALVSDIQNAINSTVMVTDEGTKTVEEGVSVANQTANAFAGVTDAMNNVVLNSQQISLNVQQQAVAIQQVVDAMNGLNVAAKETASGITQIKVGTQSLNNAATELKVLV